ncbi:hypothetical protein TevJSym_ab01280 [endosymbiont of Tevnia jerichonana (vent Tica)]|uniref:Uncharacterized protein n=1 Tax=endosymbiont of Tevnia jerichonana (vent Tica) TaxID=1049564 RepID=G2FBU4_9GAMM|nr:hypothetical protein TevJSym_ab01280 [endosymbiont of Tevnia jerichonana (vent Tica)]
MGHNNICKQAAQICLNIDRFKGDASLTYGFEYSGGGDCHYDYSFPEQIFS